MKDIEGYEGLYAVTENGEVWSYPKKWGGKTLNQSHNGIWLVPKLSKKGYLRIGLTQNGRTRIFSIHRLVGYAYLPEIPGKDHINHKDKDRTNNHYSNLEWCTVTENNRHRLTSL